MAYCHTMHCSNDTNFINTGLKLLPSYFSQRSHANAIVTNSLLIKLKLKKGSHKEDLMLYLYVFFNLDLFSLRANYFNNGHHIFVGKFPKQKRIKALIHWNNII